MCRTHIPFDDSFIIFVHTGSQSTFKSNSQHLYLFVCVHRVRNAWAFLTPQGQPLINDHGITNAAVPLPPQLWEVWLALSPELPCGSVPQLSSMNFAWYHNPACPLSPPGPTSPTPLPVVPWSLFLINYFHTNSPLRVCFKETHIRHCENNLHITFFLLRYLVFLFFWLDSNWYITLPSQTWRIWPKPNSEANW